MKKETKDVPHPYRHVRRNGAVVYVTKQHKDRLYRRGVLPPNYPVPAIQFKVCFYASGDCIEIRSFKGIGAKRSYIDRIFWKPV